MLRAWSQSLVRVSNLRRAEREPEACILQCESDWSILVTKRWRTTELRFMGLRYLQTSNFAKNAFAYVLQWTQTCLSTFLLSYQGILGGPPLKLITLLSHIITNWLLQYRKVQISTDQTREIGEKNGRRRSSTPMCWIIADTSASYKNTFSSRYRSEKMVNQVPSTKTWISHTCLWRLL